MTGTTVSKNKSQIKLMMMTTVIYTRINTYLSRMKILKIQIKSKKSKKYYLAIKIMIYKYYINII